MAVTLQTDTTSFIQGSYAPEIRNCIDYFNNDGGVQMAGRQRGKAEYPISNTEQAMMKWGGVGGFGVFLV